MTKYDICPNCDTYNTIYNYNDAIHYCKECDIFYNYILIICPKCQNNYTVFLITNIDRPLNIFCTQCKTEHELVI